MPGIVGVITRRPAAETEPVVRTMVASLRHEGFYQTGTHAAPELGVYAGWVAHEHSFAAGQIFRNEQKDVTLVFSGECYLDPLERNRLRHNGHHFAETGGDWLVHAYEEQKEKFFENLNGLFSGLLIDRRQRRVFLFNDRYGLERIYWHQTKEAFYFASEAKALLRVLPELREFDREGAAQFLGVGCALAGRTLFRNVCLLPGGSRWTFENGGCRRENYFSPEQWEALPKLPGPEYEAQFQAVFGRILSRYYAADSKVGISLTGGLDTRLVMACHPHDARREICYTFTGPTGQTLDDRVAARVAAACGLAHQLLRLGPDFFSDFAAHADRTVFITDGCSGVLGAHEIYLHRLARALATLRLTGNYGSEICRAISTFKPLGLATEIFQPDFLPAVNAAAGQLAAGKKHPDSFAAFQEVPLNLFGNLVAGRSQLSFRTPYLDNELVALTYQCPASLKKSSLPAMRLVKACCPALDRIPTDRGFISDRSDPEIFARRIFAEVTFKLDYCSNAGLPRPFGPLDPVFKPLVRALGIAGLHKFLKYSTWFRQELTPYLTLRIDAARKTGNGFWNAGALGRIIGQHLSGRKDFPSEINAVLTLESLERQLFRELPRGLEISQ
ncbi:MAG TPA: asparagine synthase-related protein [Candidatus Acidoferrales bacterium]|nr:asparagine synthase-related protein [Candidatus Acidoferrales bacterium]